MELERESARDAARLIDGVWDHDAPADTERALRVMLEEAAVGSAEWSLQARTQVARAQGLQRKFEDAHATLDAVEAELRDDTSLARVRFHLERGRVFNSTAAGDRAERHFRAAWDAACAIDAEFYAIDAAHMMAIVAEPAEAIRWNERALALATEARDERARGWVGSLCNNIGWRHHAQGRFDEAFVMFERALGAREAAGVTRDVRVARWCLARCLRSLGRVSDALSRQQELAAELDATGDVDGYVDEEIAECLHALGREGEARPYFRRAFERLAQDPWLTEAEPERLARLETLAGDADAP